MEVIKTLPYKNLSGKKREMVLLKCCKCGVEKEARKDSKQTTPFCKKCYNSTHGDT